MDKKLDSVNLLASDRYFHALDSVLRKESSEYAILARKEWKTCLTNDNGKWKVSFIERNRDVNPMYFSNVNDACLYLIDSVSPKRKVKKIRTQYLKSII